MAAGRNSIPKLPARLDAGFSLRFPEDQENLAHQFDVYDALYAWCRLDVAKSKA